MKKLLTTLAVRTTIATPAFAHSHKGADAHNSKTTLSQGALRAFATVPGAGSIADPNAPAATGGGSTGYNEMLGQF